MLHSYHYYACYYALICLLHQHQQATSLTIIIDGATTNEWATRDEYQRLVEASATNPAAPLHGQRHGQVVGRHPVSEADNYEARQQQEELEQQQQQQQQLSLDRQLQQQQEQENNEEHQQEAGPSPTAAKQLESALDRLDLIEEQRRRASQLQRLRQLEQRQQFNNHNGHNSNRIAPHQAPQQQQQPSTVAATLGARTLNDLVPMGDDDLDGDPLARLRERDSAPQKICGKQLIDVLEVVCRGRFYAPADDVEIVNPTISKRFVDYDQQQQQKHERRRNHSKMRRYRAIRGPSSECCKNSCTIDQLKTFCSTKP